MENLNEIKTPAGEVFNNELDTTQDYIATIAEMKANSVSKADYAKLRADNQKLLNALVNGEKIEVAQEKPVNVDELRKKLFNRDGDLSNLEYVDSALKLRNALIERGERDPFLPCGSHVNLTAEMYDKAEAVANLLQDCVDYADGDSQLFTAKYQSMVKDPNGFRPRR